MTSSEPQVRKKSALSEDEMWTVPAVPPPAPAPPRPPAQSAAPTTPAAATPADTEQRRVRDLEEARGRNRVRSAIFAWAAAEQRATMRLQECGSEITAALQRGTAPTVLEAFVAEACERHGVDPAMLPEQFRAAVGIPTGE